MTKPTYGTPGTGPMTGGRKHRGWWKSALGHHAYALVALPVSLAGPIAALFGKAGSIDRAQRMLARRTLAVPVAEPPAQQTVCTLRFCMVSLPANLLTFAVLAPIWVLFLVNGVLWPVFDGPPERSWGGPTLAGAWAAHFFQGPPLLLALTLALWPISRFQARQAHEYLGSGTTESEANMYGTPPPVNPPRG